MKNTLKKAFAAVLAAALCLSFSGCYDENKTWAAKKGEETLPIGSYIYYLNSSYSEAMGKVASDAEVLKSTIDGKDAETWIKERAESYVRSYYYVKEKFDELGLELTEEDNTSIDSNTDSYWSYYKTGFENMGIAKESFRTAFTLYNTKMQKLMYAMYGKGGEMELSDDDLKDYVVDNYYNYSYFSASLTTTDEDGNSTSLTDEEKTALKTKLEGYVKTINSGKTTIQEAATEYAKDELGGEENSTFSEGSPVQKDNLNDAVRNGIESVKDKEAVFVETSSAYLVIYRLPVEDGFDSMIAEESGRNNLISTMKSEEFDDYVLEQSKNVEGVELNTAAMNSIKLKSMVTDSNKNGTSSAASDDDTTSSQAEGDASGVSSES